MSHPYQAPSTPVRDRGPATPGAGVSVLLVREWEQQMSSSGCCGRVEGDFLDLGPEADRIFAGRRAEMESAGVLYRALRARYGEGVEIRVLDPRNLLALGALVVRQARRHGVPLRTLIRTLLGLSVNMVIVNGRVVARNRWPSSEELLEQVESARRAGGHEEREEIRSYNRRSS